MHLSINKGRLSNVIARWIVMHVRAIEAKVDQSKVSPYVCVVDAGCYGDVMLAYPRRLKA